MCQNKNRIMMSPLRHQVLACCIQVLVFEIVVFSNYNFLVIKNQKYLVGVQSYQLFTVDAHTVALKQVIGK